MCNRIISIIGNLILLVFIILANIENTSKDSLYALFQLLLVFNATNLLLETYSLCEYFWKKFKK